MKKSDSKVATKVEIFNGNLPASSNNSRARNFCEACARFFGFRKHNNVDPQLHVADHDLSSTEKADAVDQENVKNENVETEKKNCPDCFPLWMQIKLVCLIVIDYKIYQITYKNWMLMI